VGRLTVGVGAVGVAGGSLPQRTAPRAATNAAIQVYGMRVTARVGLNQAGSYQPSDLHREIREDPVSHHREIKEIWESVKPRPDLTVVVRHFSFGTARLSRNVPMGVSRCHHRRCRARSTRYRDLEDAVERNVVLFERGNDAVVEDVRRRDLP
jgi:hypothetical protein